jgi:hypothetical protein
MSTKTIMITLATATGFAAFSFAPEQSAIGSVRAPAAIMVSPFTETAVTKDQQKNTQKLSKPKAFLAKLKDRWSKFRPVAKGANLDLTPVYTSQTTIEKLFDAEFTARMKNEHAAVVAPMEKEALNPYRRSSHWEMQRYEESRKALAQWTMKELGRDQLKEFIRLRKKDSAALGLVAATTGGADLGAESPKTSEEVRPNYNEQDRLARAHAYTPVSEQEEIIPTRLRARLNILKTQGQVTFVNPIVTTSVEARAGSGDNLAVEMKKDFKKLELNSHMRYAVDQSRLVFNVNKKITDEVSLDLNSERWTGSKRGSDGEKAKDTAKVTYSISF